MSQPQGFPRTLTTRESAVLDLVAGAISPRPITENLQVTGMCECGCPTIYFTQEPIPHVLMADAMGPQPLQVLLFGNSEALDSLELVFGETESEFPAPETLTYVTAH